MCEAFFLLNCLRQRKLNLEQEAISITRELTDCGDDIFIETGEHGSWISRQTENVFFIFCPEIQRLARLLLHFVKYFFHFFFLQNSSYKIILPDRNSSG